MKIDFKDTRITTNEFTIDPVGTIFYFEERVFRCINNEYINHTLDLINCGLVKELSEKQLFPKTHIATDIYINGYELVIEHEKIPYATRPCEWSFSMFKDILLTLVDVLKIANNYGYTLKDGHPTNLSFLGHKPMFFDFGSFILSQGGTWNAYDEFVENALIPIKLWSCGEFYIANRLLSDYVKNRFAPNIKLKEHSYIKHIIGNKEEKKHLFNNVKIFSKNDENLFLINNFSYKALTLLREQVSSLNKPDINTDWNKYHDRFFDGNSIIPYERFEKHADFIKNYGVDTLIDLAGNRGLFSFFASKKGIKNILCTDRDENAIDILYQHLKNSNMDNNSITPMLHNVMYPISSRFSNYKERISADAVVAFALTHHLLLTQNIPIDYILQTIGDHSKKLVGIEFMPLGLWDGLSGAPPPPVPEWYTREWFRMNFSRYFSLIHEEHIEKNRIIFWGEKKSTRTTEHVEIHKKGWKNVEYFDEAWKRRIAIMASLIEQKQSVLDLGCGMQWLKGFLPADTQYYPVDYISRSDNTIICDFNHHQFPNIHVDVAFISGVLEYVEDYRWFINSISKCCQIALVSYCAIDDFPVIQERRSLFWVNDLAKSDVVSLFKVNSMELVSVTEHKRNTIFRFSKKAI